jgi:hypothetical protein
MNQPIASESALSAFFRNFPDTLRQPFALAVIGSVGAHLFFFLWLPLFTTEETKPEVKRVVRLLNSPLQAQASTSAIGLPPIPKTPDSTVKIPLGQGLLPPIPPDVSLYKFPDPIIPPAPPVFRFSSPTTVFPNPLLSRTFNPPPSLVRSDPTTIPNPTQTPLTTPPPPSGETDTKIPLLPAGIVPPTTTPAAPSTTPPTSTTPATISPSTRPRVFAENQRLRDSITFKSLGATPNEVADNNIASYKDWYQKNVIDRGITDKNLAPKNIPVPDVPYKSPFNLTEKFEPAYINVLIAPDGKISAPLTVIGRTGYGILDALALDEVSKLVINDQKAGKLMPTGDDAGKYVLYKYIVTFKVSRTA